MLLNPTDHPPGTRVLMHCAQYRVLTEAVVLEWSPQGSVKLDWVLGKYQSWIEAERIEKHPIRELLSALPRS